jgi:hypothetical protein
MIDRSGSMSEMIRFGAEMMPKSEAVAFVANTFIDELLHRARREHGVCDYYDMAVLGYSGDGVEWLIGDKEAFTTPSRLAAQNVRRQKVVRERVLPSGKTTLAATEHNMWIEPKAVGVTPMHEALRKALVLIEKWCRHRNNATSYPPTIINITDGEASDASSKQLSELASRIRATGTLDGKTLLINIHLSHASDDESSVIFPCSRSELPARRYASLLYEMSSVMPERYEEVIAALRSEGKPPFKGMSYNSPVNDLIAMMNINSTMI